MPSFPAYPCWILKWEAILAPALKDLWPCKLICTHCPEKSASSVTNTNPTVKSEVHFYCISNKMRYCRELNPDQAVAPPYPPPIHQNPKRTLLRIFWSDRPRQRGLTPRPSESQHLLPKKSRSSHQTIHIIFVLVPSGQEIINKTLFYIYTQKNIIRSNC